MLTQEAERQIKPEDRPHIFDAKRVHYLDEDVLTAAKRRIRHVIDTFDKISVSYSGGKDSLVVLYLTREVMDEMGRTEPLDVVFRDEELIPEGVIDFILTLNDEPDRWNLHYFAVPMNNQCFVLGEHRPYVQWDDARKDGGWMRPKPECAITDLHPEGKPLIQHEMSALISLRLGWTGRIGVLNGIRAQESLLRFRSCQSIKNGYNYITGDAGGVANQFFIKPIYDWSERDVFRFFYDRGIAYARIYDDQVLAGAQLRVSTPVHDRAFSYQRKLRSMYPQFFEQLCAIFPDILTHERYWGDIKNGGSFMETVEKYEKSYTGIMKYIDETITDPTNRARCKAIVNRTYVSKNNFKRSGKYAEPGGCYGYPLLHVWRQVVTGNYLKGIQVHSNPEPSMITFEREAEAEAAARSAAKRAGR